MRTSEDLSKQPAYFCNDVENGGVLVYCPVCAGEFVDRTNPDEPCICPNCETELFYRPWFEW